MNDYLREKDHSLFLEPTDEEEIHNIVSQFSLKRSIDYHDINMYCVKYIFASITKPLMHICNFSFSTGIFPDEMEIARDLYLKIKMNLKTTDQFPFYPNFQKLWRNYLKKRLNGYVE